MSLITVAELCEALAGDPPALLDVRWELGGPPGRDLYLDGHIPGAAFVDLDTALAGPPGAGVVAAPVLRARESGCLGWGTQGLAGRRVRHRARGDRGRARGLRRAAGRDAIARRGGCRRARP